jgi:hypothetical protein
MRTRASIELQRRQTIVHVELPLQPDDVQVVAVRANIRSILVAMMKSFSCSPFGLQRDRRVAPTEADIRMMTFSFREFTNLVNKGERLPEIAEPKAPFDVVSVFF